MILSAAFKRNAKSWWIAEEDRKLYELVTKHGAHNWDTIANLFESRTAKQCRQRWVTHVCPGVRKDEWTSDEDKLLMELVKEFGPKWSKMRNCFAGRTDNDIKNHYVTLVRYGLAPAPATWHTTTQVIAKQHSTSVRTYPNHSVVSSSSSSSSSAGKNPFSPHWRQNFDSHRDQSQPTTTNSLNSVTSLLQQSGLFVGNQHEQIACPQYVPDCPITNRDAPNFVAAQGLASALLNTHGHHVHQHHPNQDEVGAKYMCISQSQPQQQQHQPQQHQPQQHQPQQHQPQPSWQQPTMVPQQHLIDTGRKLPSFGLLLNVLYASPPKHSPHSSSSSSISNAMLPPQFPPRAISISRDCLSSSSSSSSSSRAALQNANASWVPPLCELVPEFFLSPSQSASSHFEAVSPRLFPSSHSLPW